MWHQYSIVIVDWTNGQDQVKMKEINHIQKYKGLTLPKKIEIEKKKHKQEKWTFSLEH